MYLRVGYVFVLQTGAYLGGISGKAEHKNCKRAPGPAILCQDIRMISVKVVDSILKFQTAVYIYAASTGCLLHSENSFVMCI